MEMSKCKLFFDIESQQCPILYSQKYDIHFYGIEKLHPFDVRKWGRTHKKLIQRGVIKPGQSVEPNEASDADLLQIHTKDYLNSLKYSINIARISEVCPLLLIPACVLNSKLLKHLRYQTGGSILGTKLAKERGWAINLGGGFHHCSAKRGGGFCFYADISLCVKFLLDTPELNTGSVMIVDLDAHQGNGYAMDWGSDERVFILDAFNQAIYPNDVIAKAKINFVVKLSPYTGNEQFVEAVESSLTECLSKFKPDFVIDQVLSVVPVVLFLACYNAGTDILENDPLGNLRISKKAIIQRDQIVFQKCIQERTPILMLTSGGYQWETADIIADSIENLVSHGIISLTEENV